MGVYAYCVVPAGHRPPAGLAGLAGGSVRALAMGELAVWVSDVTSRPSLELEAVAQHHEVVRSAAAVGTVAPLRFGAWAAEEGALRERIDASREGLEQTLRTLDGAVELGVRVIERCGEASGGRVDPPSDGAGTGRDYLRRLSVDRARRKARRARQDELAGRVRGRLASVLCDQRVQYLEAPELVSLAHLVRRADEGEYRRRVAAFAREETHHVEIHVSGPWPPYSFATAT
jgi:hypothetical protein